MTPPPEPPPRSVKPRTRKRRRLPVVAIIGDEVLTEAGEVLTLKELTATLPEREPTLFAATSSADLIAIFTRTFMLTHPNAWQWKVSDYERELYHPNARRPAYRVDIAVHFFGFHHGNFHKMIDPVTMYGRLGRELWPGDDPPIIKLLAWATTLRDFCAENNLDVRPTTGSISAQFLTDSRFYPEPRRKVPAKTNERAREHLPGNHYLLTVEPSPDQEHRAYYLDQHRAHHHHAARIHFPDANHLYAFGHFQTLDHPFRELLDPSFNGLLCLDLEAPWHDPHFTWLDRRHLERQFVFSNELPHILDMGYRVTGVRAAWGSHHRDTGLNKYAMWASQQLDHYDGAKWLKPLLLATYGTLACRPTFAEAVFRIVKNGEPATLHTGRHKLNGRSIRRPRALEPGIANVIHRGMIEAATRSESIGFAQYLKWTGQRVLSIYADAVVVELDDDKPLPEPLPEPWEVEAELNHLQFINQQAFISDGMTKLPGVGQEIKKYRQRMPGHAPRRKDIVVT